MSFILFSLVCCLLSWAVPCYVHSFSAVMCLIPLDHPVNNLFWEIGTTYMSPISYLVPSPPLPLWRLMPSPFEVCRVQLCDMWKKIVEETAKSEYLLSIFIIILGLHCETYNTSRKNDQNLLFHAFVRWALLQVMTWSPFYVIPWR